MFELPPLEVSWLQRDVLLFANSIGVTAKELHLLYVSLLFVLVRARAHFNVFSPQELHPRFMVFPTYPLILRTYYPAREAEPNARPTIY